jgi:nitrogen-specific signal transduction histidine kinase
MQNRIKRIEKKGDSNEIGLISSRKMIQQHDGTLTFKHEKGIFTLEIVLPIILYGDE